MNMFVAGMVFTIWYQLGLRFASLAFYKDYDEQRRWQWMKDYLDPDDFNFQNVLAIFCYLVMALLGPINAMWYSTVPNNTEDTGQ